jgi:hypothetical protein
VRVFEVDDKNCVSIMTTISCVLVDNWNLWLSTTMTIPTFYISLDFKPIPPYWTLLYTEQVIENFMDHRTHWN